MPALDFPVRLRIVRRGADVRHARDSNKFLEVLSHELGSIIRNDAWLAVRATLLGTLQDDLDICLLHRLAQIPVHNKTAVPIQHAAQIVERAAHIDVGNINMPMLVWRRGLLEAGPFLRRFPLPPRQQPRLSQYPPNAGRTHRHHVGVQHHERQSPVAFQRIVQMKIDDGLFFPGFQPEISGNPSVVLVHLAVALAPVVELAGGYHQPANETSGADLGLL